MKLKEMMKELQSGRFQAIVKNVAGRRMFLGIERKNTRSRKRHQKFMCSPQDLDQLLAKQKPAEPTVTLDNSTSSPS